MRELGRPAPTRRSPPRSGVSGGAARQAIHRARTSPSQRPSGCSCRCPCCACSSTTPGTQLAPRRGRPRRQRNRSGCGRAALGGGAALRGLVSRTVLIAGSVGAGVAVEQSQARQSRVGARRPLTRRDRRADRGPISAPSGGLSRRRPAREEAKRSPETSTADVAAARRGCGGSGGSSGEAGSGGSAHEGPSARSRPGGGRGNSGPTRQPRRGGGGHPARLPDAPAPPESGAGGAGPGPGSGAEGGSWEAAQGSGSVSGTPRLLGPRALRGSSGGWERSRPARRCSGDSSRPTDSSEPGSTALRQFRSAPGSGSARRVLGDETS